jgi:uncharacterized protein YaeQ
VYTYGGRGADIWWNQNSSKLERLNNLTVINLPEATSQAMATLVQRTMQLQFTVQDDEIWVSDNNARIEVELATLKTPSESFR